MNNEGFNELNAQAFLQEIRQRPTAEHPIEQLAHAETVVAKAQDAEAQRRSFTFTYEGRRIGPFSERLVVQPKTDGLIKVAQSLRR